ncbi:MAG: hypothetical protein WCS31_08290 [Verrucomicrobiae bacterium]
MKREISNGHWFLPLFLGLIVTEDVVPFFVMLEAGGLGVGQMPAKNSQKPVSRLEETHRFLSRSMRKGRFREDDDK